MQMADELMENWDQENRTLHSDGTLKHGRSLITYDVVKDDGNCLIAGLREVSSGDSETQRKVLEDVLSDVSEMFDSCGLEKDLNESRSTKDKIIKSINNVMSDRCAVQKKFNNLFSCYRKEILPSVVQECGKTSQKMRKKRWQLSMNYFVGCIFSLGLLIRQKLAAKFGIIFVGGFKNWFLN